MCEGSSADSGIWLGCSCISELVVGTHNGIWGKCDIGGKCATYLFWKPMNKIKLKNKDRDTFDCATLYVGPDFVCKSSLLSYLLSLLC